VRSFSLVFDGLPRRTLRPCPGEPRARALHDEIALHLRERSEHVARDDSMSKLAGFIAGRSGTAMTLIEVG